MKPTALPLILCTILSTAAAEVTYPIVDTGQTEAYGRYAGQDAHYCANPPNYKDHGDGTVSDLVTGLMWTKTPGKKRTYAKAVEQAAQCCVGGHDDWRLPSIKELYSLIRLDGTDPDPMSRDTQDLTPFIDAVFDFEYGDPSKGERIIDSQFATTTKYESTTMGGNETLFGVNFADGRIKGYPIKSRRGAKTYYALFVRGNPDYGTNVFKDNGDGTITDAATGLIWMKTDSAKGMDWPDALNFAEEMRFAGQSDWRLPNAKELQSIIDYTRSPDTTGSAAIDPVFECTEIKNEGGQSDFAYYWTSSTHVSSRGSDTAVYFAFGRSPGWMGPDGNKKLMDVHGAGSQRSDPKVGDAAHFPYGRGPQGDVIRIDNMVRLVRGGGVETVPAETTSESLTGRRTSQPTKPRVQGHRGAPPADRLFSRFDSDNNDLLSIAEFKGPKRRFAILDQNHDGNITREEVESAPPPF